MIGVDPVAIDEALARNLTFPARWYSDPAIYEIELERIFTRSWQLAGPLHRIERPGDHFVCSAAHVPIVVTRDLEGELRGFVNVCRHRAFPVAREDGNRKTLQCAYHGWTYELDGTLRHAPGCELEADLDMSEFSLLPVAVDTWGGFVWVNPDPDALSFRDTYPEFEPLAESRGLDFRGWRYRQRYDYDIPANWKVFVENATECYHCPTVHSKSFSDAFDTTREVYEYVNVGRLLGQFTGYNANARVFTRNGGGRAFRFVYVWPTSFFLQDDYVASSGAIVPTGPESCSFVAELYANPECDEAVVDEWIEMYNLTIAEDVDAVRVQQPGLRSRMVPHGRLMPSRESAISSFHRMVWDSLREALAE